MISQKLKIPPINISPRSGAKY